MDSQYETSAQATARPKYGVARYTEHAVGCANIPARLAFKLLLLLSLPATSYALDLVEAYQAAFLQDAVFAAAQANNLAGQEKLPQARAGLLPSIGVQGSKGNNKISNSTFNGTAQPDYDYQQKSYTLQLSQPIFRWANWQNYEQSKLFVALSETQFEQAKLDLILRVSQAYFDVLNSQDNISLLAAQKAAVLQQLSSAKQNFEVGNASITDTYEAQSRYDLVVAQELAAQSDLEIKLHALAKVIGTPVQNIAPLKKEIALPQPEPVNLSSWVEQAEKLNYNVQQQLLTEEIAKRNIEKAKAEHYPTVDLVASTNRSSGSTAVNNGLVSSNTQAIAVQFSVPLFSGGATISKVRESRALQDKARFDVEAARRNAAQAAKEAFLGVTTGAMQVKALQAAETSSLSSVEATKLGYQVGVRINIDVLNAEQQLFQTRRDLSKARYEALLASLRLKASNASLTENDLNTLNQLLETSAP